MELVAGLSVLEEEVCVVLFLDALPYGHSQMPFCRYLMAH
jgi:hypothetical protein